MWHDAPPARALPAPRDPPEALGHLGHSAPAAGDLGEGAGMKDIGEGSLSGSEGKATYPAPTLACSSHLTDARP